jgi:hypothetical protein
MEIGAAIAPKAVKRPSRNLVVPRSPGDAATAALALQQTFAVATSKAAAGRSIAQLGGADFYCGAQFSHRPPGSGRAAYAFASRFSLKPAA